MAEDDIERLLREVESSTGGASAQPSGKSKGGGASGGGELSPKPSDEVEQEGAGGLGTWEQMAIAAGAGALVTFLVFLLPIIGSFGLLSRVLAGAVGGAVGYGVARAMLNRGKSDE